MINVQLPESVLVEHFDHETLRRGRDYAESGNVLGLHVGEQSGGVTLSGTVAGTRHAPYDVEVFLEVDDEPAGERKAALFARVMDGDGAMAADITADDVRAIFA